MPDLLFELFSEEIPARMQAQASDDLKRLVTGAIVDAGLTYEGAIAHATPRRLALHVAGIPARQPDTREERKGPRVGSPPAALAGFLKGAGLASIEEARIVSDAKRGDFYVAFIEKAGRDSGEVLAEILPQVIKSFPWPKSMRWGKASVKTDSLRWVRPLHSIVATFGPETEEPDIVAFEVDGIEAGNITYGHRFMAPEPIRVRRFDDYAPALAKARVVLDAARRRDMIVNDARDLAFAQGLELVEDEALLAEVAGLVEWPVVLLGSFDAEFLDIPPEVVRTTIRANQKCFVLRGADGGLANKFVLVANLVAPDGGKTIVAGNQRVVRARLSDAKFFWQSDLAVPLDARLTKLDSIIFHAKLGSQGERVRRIEELAATIGNVLFDRVVSYGDEALREIGPFDRDRYVGDIKRAALLAKADLVTEMVGEFPELQGTMGRYYALAQGEEAAVAAAIEDHYKPQGPSDRVPSHPVSIAVALADKLDTLVGFWAIDEKPTGSKDPYALRRAAFGVIRIVLENGLRLRLVELVNGRFDYVQVMNRLHEVSDRIEQIESLGGRQAVGMPVEAFRREIFGEQSVEPEALHLLNFFADRLKVYLREQGARHDLIDAVFALPGQDDLLMIVRRVEALGGFLETDDGKSLLAGYKRAANILRAEERKDGEGAFAGDYDPGLAVEEAEKALGAAVAAAEAIASEQVAAEDFAGAMTTLASLRAPVDSFFEEVTVNAPDPLLRLNRLRLLNQLRRAMHEVADFSKIAG